MRKWIKTYEEYKEPQHEKETADRNGNAYWDNILLIQEYIPKKLQIVKGDLVANYSYEFTKPMPNYLGNNFNLDEEFERNGDDFPSRCVIDFFTKTKEEGEMVCVEISLGDMMIFNFNIMGDQVYQIDDRDIVTFNEEFVEGLVDFMNKVFGCSLNADQFDFITGFRGFSKES